MEGVASDWNRKVAMTTDYSEGLALGEPLVERVIFEDFRESVSQVHGNALYGDRVATFEFPLFTLGGCRRAILLSATARRISDGRVEGTFSVGLDITELGAISSGLRRIADDLTRLIKNAKSPIFTCDADGHIAEWNRPAADIPGLSTGEAMGWKFVEEFITGGRKAGY